MRTKDGSQPSVGGDARGALSAQRAREQWRSELPATNVRKDGEHTYHSTVYLRQEALLVNACGEWILKTAVVAAKSEQWDVPPVFSWGSFAQ